MRWLSILHRQRFRSSADLRLSKDEGPHPRQISSTPSLPVTVEKVCKACACVKLKVPGMVSFKGRGVRKVGQSVVTPVRCMANPRRVKMVAKQILRELSDMLLTDKVLQYAVLPEVALGADRYLSSLTTISDVEVSGDLQVVKVFVSVFGDERGKEVAISGLKSKAKYVRGELGRRMKLRITPEIRFIEDESIERGSRVIAILDRLKSDKPIEDDEDGSSNLPQDDDYSDFEDDPDVIYVK